MTSAFDSLAIATLRGLAMDMPALARSGHSGTALALAPLGWWLYSRVLRHDPADPGWPDRDRLVLSNGHACVLLYGLLHLCGYSLSLDDLRQFRRPGSRTPGHPESWITPGVDFSTGPLGQGLASAVGLAWGERLLQQRFGPELVDHHTYVLCSDGDLMEGVSCEACSLAGHQQLGKLIVFYDDNSVTIDGTLAMSCSEDFPAAFAARGWQVLEVASGEDLEGLQTALELAHADPRPSFLRVPTTIGWPAPRLRGSHLAHSPHFPPEEIAETKAILGLDPNRHFWIPDQLAQATRAIQEKGRQLNQRWKARLQQSPLQEQWEQFHLSPPASPSRPRDQQATSTRVASGQQLQALVSRLPNLIGGSADLAGSTQTHLPESPDRQLHFGVREQAMAAICNGLASHGGWIPFCSTYFAFSDQMKPGLRLAALARLGVIFVWSHDSLALGEDGPTHQPVEQLAALRALPNFWVFRPADAEETAQAWELALQRRDGPSGLVLSRQTLPPLPEQAEIQVERGAYLVQEGPETAPTILATGSEVCLALEACRRVNFAVRVVSMPCWELFEQQPQEYQQKVLGNGPRLAIEAASPLGWHRWLQGRGQVLGVDSFGASGPGPELMEAYGFSPEAVAERLRRLVSGSETG